MRPRLIEYFNNLFHTDIFSYLIPDPAVVYAIMLGLGIIFLLKRCKATGLDTRHAAGIAIWGSVAALLGARLFYLVQNISYTYHHPEILFELNGATVSFGVYLGGITGIILYGVFYHISLWKYLDVVASVLGIGPMVGRFACFLNGCDYGTLSNLPWAVQFPKDSFTYSDHLYKGLISYADILSLPVHPVQLFCVLKGFILFVVFSILWKKDLFKPGVLFFLFWMSYAVFRFLIEFFRGDENRGWVGELSTGQFMSCSIFLVSLGFVAIKYKWKIIKEDLNPKIDLLVT
ncbi:MAG: prolipoprotein diacylglyceryl transferase [Bacteroidota bacterium]|nr:prolipoprotein diacylglyceryl transferase [Bacteroidota bacterium]